MIDKNNELGDCVSALFYDATEKEFKPISGKLAGIFVDPHGRQFAQLKKADGSARNVDLCTVNASSEVRAHYMETIKQVQEVEQAGNKDIEEHTAAIVEACNSEINELYATLSPLIDLSMDEVEHEGVESELSEDE